MKSAIIDHTLNENCLFSKPISPDVHEIDKTGGPRPESSIEDGINIKYSSWPQEGAITGRI